MTTRTSMLALAAAALAACGAGSTKPAGTGADACDGLVPAAPGDGVAFVQPYPTGMNACDVLTDGRGEWIGVNGLSYEQLGFAFVSAAAPGAPAGHLAIHLPSYGKGGPLVAPQPDGYHVLSRPDYWPGSLQRHDAQGNLLSDDGRHDVWGVYALPGGGSVLDTAQGYAPNGGNGVAHMVWASADGTRGADVVGASPVAISSRGDVLALADGKLRWYDRNGAPSSEPFTDAALLATLQNGSGLARRLVAPADGSLVFGLGTGGATRFVPGATQRSPVPDWLTSRAGAEIAAVRGGKANAFATRKEGAPGCDVEIEILTAGGERCGTARLVAAAPCGAVSFGPDGTVFTTGSAASGETTTCTWRWWSGLLR